VVGNQPSCRDFCSNTSHLSWLLIHVRISSQLPLWKSAMAVDSRWSPNAVGFPCESKSKGTFRWDFPKNQLRFLVFPLHSFIVFVSFSGLRLAPTLCRSMCAMWGIVLLFLVMVEIRKLGYSIKYSTRGLLSAGSRKCQGCQVKTRLIQVFLFKNAIQLLNIN